MKEKKTTEKETKLSKKADFAIVETGGKQYCVEEGSVITVETIPDAKDGGEVIFDKVLLTSIGGEVHVGAPFLPNAKVEATILEQGRSKKVDVVHYKQKSRYYKKYGHRQPFLKVRIGSLTKSSK